MGTLGIRGLHLEGMIPMGSLDVIGYAFDADTYCEDCTEKMYPGATDWRRDGFDPSDYTDSEGNELHPIFGDDESDHPDHCGRCGVFLENALTSDGYATVIRILSDTAIRWEDKTREYREAYFDRYSDAFDPDDWETLARAWSRRVFQRLESEV